MTYVNKNTRKNNIRRFEHTQIKTNAYYIEFIINIHYINHKINNKSFLFLSFCTFIFHY